MFAFLVIAMISSIAAFSSDLEALRGVTMASRFVRNMLTLVLGLLFYLTVALLPESWDDLKFSLRWLYAGFAIALAWGSLQIFYIIHYIPRYFKLLNRLQAFLSTRKLFTTRISGMTYEPKWFAEQICFLLLPFLLVAVISRRSVFPWRYKWITVELLLLVWACFVLVFTYSRTGLFILAVLVILGYLLNRLQLRARRTTSLNKERKKGRLILELSAITITLLAVLFLAGSQNPYFSRLWRYWTEARNRNRTYLEYIAVEQRFVYWQTAFRIFETRPLLGVGLGNYAFYFDTMLPNEPLGAQNEIVRQVTPAEGRDRLITPKNLYARLLAETGLLGAATFTSFIVALIGCILFLWFSQTPEQIYWGLSGALAMVVFAILIFSFDSFAMPNMWIVFGLITASGHILEPSGPSEVPELVPLSNDPVVLR
jgi:hypothetical protein